MAVTEMTDIEWLVFRYAQALEDHRQAQANIEMIVHAGFTLDRSLPMSIRALLHFEAKLAQARIDLQAWHRDYQREKKDGLPTPDDRPDLGQENAEGEASPECPRP